MCQQKYALSGASIRVHRKVWVLKGKLDVLFIPLKKCKAIYGLDGVRDMRFDRQT